MNNIPRGKKAAAVYFVPEIDLISCKAINNPKLYLSEQKLISKTIKDKVLIRRLDSISISTSNKTVIVLISTYYNTANDCPTVLKFLTCICCLLDLVHDRENQSPFADYLLFYVLNTYFW
ncbi:hypothetical protein TNCV_4708461 [Trichonephila clavipes]|nr:hypothetical protein TNCV_4708461 [Trichonephila clavipes]